ncbi:MAG: trypsin-like peptidase domain-containing protein [Planctomycetota bacterium]
MVARVARLVAKVLAGAAIGVQPCSADRTAESDSVREAQRIRVVEQRVLPATLAVVEYAATNGGSGVIVSSDGVAVTNYHVVQPCGPAMLCGMSDGSVVEAVLLGADPAGDLAAIRLLDDTRVYQPAALGDTTRSRVGDEVIVAGNPLLVADDFSPSVSVGVLSGKNRYQYPSGDLLEYSDCLQTDAAINLGNSGGPLFDARGELLGIVGRASFEKRGRVSVGVGYAISVEQVRRFLPALVAGCVPDHGALGFTIRSATGRQTGGPRIDRIETDSAAYACGLRVGDEIVRLDDRKIDSANALMNHIGATPAHWPVAVTFRRADATSVTEFRLPRQHEKGRLYEEVRRSLAGPAAGLTAWMRRYGAAEGFANAKANRDAAIRVLTASSRVAAPPGVADDQWRFRLDRAERNTDVTLTVMPETLRWRSARFAIELRRGLSYRTQASPGIARAVVVGLGTRMRFTELATAARYVGALPWRPGGEPCDVLRSADADAETDFYFTRNKPRLVGWTTRIAGDGREADFEPDDRGVLVRVLGEDPVRINDRPAAATGAR